MQLAVAHNEYPVFHPKKFALWVAIASIIMFFAAFTSAYIVRKGAGNWEEFRMPDVFLFSTIVILISSLTIHWAKVSLHNDKQVAYKQATGLSLGLGLLFLFLQLKGWSDLQHIGVYLDGNPSGSFLYVITGAHAVHLAGGLLILSFAFIDALVNYSGTVKSLIYETNPGKKLRIDLIATYWHFVGILWIYLYLFFYFNNL